MMIANLSGNDLAPANSPGRQSQRSRGLWVLYGVLAAVLIGTLVARSRTVTVSDGRTPPDPNRLAAVDQRIDPNTATWVELALLPGLGETLSKRIVAHREAAQAETGRSGPVFTCLEDLDTIRGIGPGKIAQWEGLLDFSREEPALIPDH